MVKTRRKLRRFIRHLRQAVEDQFAAEIPKRLSRRRISRLGVRIVMLLGLAIGFGVGVAVLLTGTGWIRG